MDESPIRHADLVTALRRAVFDSAGYTDAGIRRAAGGGGAAPEPWGPYARKVRDQSHRVTDDDIGALKAVGATEEEIFEITVAAATGAALHRLDAGLRAVRAAGRS